MEEQFKLDPKIFGQEASGDNDNERFSCDCCVPGVTITCKVFFVGYIILILVTSFALANYRNVRKRSKQPAVLKTTSKFWIIVGCISLQVMRLVYFSTAFF